jgi:M6 family metalloprotease-like protein
MNKKEDVITRTRLVIILLALALIGSTAVARNKDPLPRPVLADRLIEQSLTGTLEVLVGDPPPGSSDPTEYKFYLRQDNGRLTRLLLDRKSANISGAVTGWAGKRVEISIIDSARTLSTEKSGQVHSVSGVRLLSPDSDARRPSKTRQVTQAVQTGSKPWVTIYCKFADIPAEPARALFYERMYDNSPGGMDHYWRENSYGQMNLTGSASSFEWADLPGTLESYMTETTEIGGETKPSPDLGALFEDCTNAVDDQVDFSNAGQGFYGINMMFNETMGCCAWGGGRYRILDGVAKTWGVTWLPPWSHHHSVTAHEMGHAFGLPHSNNWDEDDDPYDNPWDVMSMSGSTRSYTAPVFGRLGPHTNAYHKYELGWMSEDRLLRVSPETNVSTTLDATSQPDSSHHQMVLIEISENTFYTVEARKRGGNYEQTLPDDAVIIHLVDKGRKEPSWAVDSDVPPADQGDNEGTMWRVGETFVSATGDIAVSIDSETTGGFRVTIDNKGIKLAESEVNALIELYNSTGGGSWTDNTNWLVGDPCADKWFGVECGIATVQNLDLTNNQLAGSLPASIGNLKSLQTLNLGNNQLSGSIPSEVGELVNLERLLLNNNQFSGSIPGELGGLAQLGQLMLSGNQLSGSIPAELGQLEEVWWLDLGNNQLTGSIPAELGNMDNLYYLYLNHNLIDGSIPPELGQLSNLRNLLLNQNLLSGGIPANLGIPPKFIWMNLGNNQLSGPIPAEFGNLSNLEYLGLNNNQLNGPIPVELGNLDELNYLLLYDNLLDGSIPATLGSLAQLIYLWLNYNQLSGPIPPGLGGLASLERMNLSGNRLSGAVPETFEDLSNLLDTHGLYLHWNALHNDDLDLEAFLNIKSENDWGPSTQTTAPRRLRISSLGADHVQLDWNPIEYTSNGGGYRVMYGTSAGGPYIDAGITPDKASNSFVISGLTPGQRYYFTVKTETESHANNKNIVSSEPSNRLSAVPTGRVFQMNAGLNDAWFYPATNGQGFFITVFPDIAYVSLSWFTYDTERPGDSVTANLADPGHRWLLALGSYSDNQAVMDISITSGGVFDTQTDVTEVNDGSIILTFTGCENGTVEFDIPSIDRQGIVPIQRVVGDNIALCEAIAEQATTRQSAGQAKVVTHTLSSGNPSTTADPQPLLDMNAGLNDAWFYQLTNGQGFFINVFPDIGYVSLSWFTYDTERPDDSVTASLGEPGHRWLNALGTYTGNQAFMDISITSGGVFDTPTGVTEINDGTIVLTFSDCENGTVEYDIPSIDQRGTVPIKRVVGDNIALCETLNQ